MSTKKPILTPYKISDAWDDVVLGSDGKEKSIASIKFVGKLGFNTALIAGKIGAEIIRNLPDIAKGSTEDMLKKGNLSKEQRERLEANLNKINSIKEQKNNQNS